MRVDPFKCNMLKGFSIQHFLSPFEITLVFILQMSGRLQSSYAKLLSVIWRLQINEDLEGEVRFASAVGPFTVPVRCTIKKCDVSNFLCSNHRVTTITLSCCLSFLQKESSFLHKYVCKCNIDLPQWNITGWLSWDNSLTTLCSLSVYVLINAKCELELAALHLLMLIPVFEFILPLAGGWQPVHRLRLARGGPDYFTDRHLNQQGGAGHLFQPRHPRVSQSWN